MNLILFGIYKLIKKHNPIYAISVNLLIYYIIIIYIIMHIYNTNHGCKDVYRNFTILLLLFANISIYCRLRMVAGFSGSNYWMCKPYHIQVINLLSSDKI